MTTATAPGGQPAVRPRPSGAPVAGGVGGAVLLTATRFGLWLGVQLLLAGLLVVVGGVGAGRALNDAAGWWMVDAALIDLGTLGVIFWLLRRDGGADRVLLGPPTTAWQVGLGALAVLAASVPAMVFSGEFTGGIYGGATAPMQARSACWWCRCWPSWPSRSPTWVWCCHGWRRAWTGPGWPPPSWWPSGLASTPATRC
jgi:hypothetical protein